MERMGKFLEKELGHAIDAEDELELELGLARKQYPYLATEIEIKGLESELKHWREKIAFIKELQKMLVSPS